MFPAAEFGTAYGELSFLISSEFDGYPFPLGEVFVDVQRLDPDSMVLIDGKGLDNYSVPLITVIVSGMNL